MEESKLNLFMFGNPKVRYVYVVTFHWVFFRLRLSVFG